jgi:lipopolysaccharide transport system permease protein
VIRQLRDIWRYRELLRELFVTWLKLRHAGSLLGLFWTLLSPAAFVFTYWLVFTHVIKIDMPQYATFLIPGYLAWNFTWNSAQEASRSMIDSSYLITKISFPAEILVLASVGVTLLEFVIALVLYLVLALLLSVQFAPVAAVLPVVILIHLLFTLGFSFFCACGSVFFKDVPKLTSIAGMVLFFCTPVFYPGTMIPKKLEALYVFNPFAPYIDSYHDVLYHNVIPGATHILAATILSLVVLVAGMRFFARLKPRFAEYD